MTDFYTHQIVILLPGTKNGFVKPNVNFTGDTDQDRLLMAPYLSGTPMKIVAGATGTDLTIDIADGATDQVIGLLVYDGAGTSPLDGIGGADQSGVLTYVYGLATVKYPTRILDPNASFGIGSKVYAGTGALKGKITDATGAAAYAADATVIGTVISNAQLATDGLMIQMAI
jgi:hypothetical protein